MLVCDQIGIRRSRVSYYITQITLGKRAKLNLHSLQPKKDKIFVWDHTGNM